MRWPPKWSTRRWPPPLPPALALPSKCGAASGGGVGARRRERLPDCESMPARCAVWVAGAKERRGVPSSSASRTRRLTRSRMASMRSAGLGPLLLAAPAVATAPREPLPLAEVRPPSPGELWLPLLLPAAPPWLTLAVESSCVRAPPCPNGSSSSSAAAPRSLVKRAIWAASAAALSGTRGASAVVLLPRWLSGPTPLLVLAPPLPAVPRQLPAMRS